MKKADLALLPITTTWVITAHEFGSQMAVRRSACGSAGLSGGGVRAVARGGLDAINNAEHCVHPRDIRVVLRTFKAVT